MKKFIILFLILVFSVVSFAAYLPLRFSNADLAVNVIPVNQNGIDMYELEFENLTNNYIDIVWDECSITDNNGNSTQFLLNDSRLLGNYDNQTPDTIGPAIKLKKLVLPRSHDTFGSISPLLLESNRVKVFIVYDVEGVSKNAYSVLEFTEIKDKGPFDDAMPWIIGGGGLSNVGIFLFISRGK